MRRSLVWMALLGSIFLLTGCNDDENKNEPKLYGLYGNYGLEGSSQPTDVYLIDTREMKVAKTFNTAPATGPYGVECDSHDEAFALTRKSESIAIINFKTGETVAVVDLPFKPRSTSTIGKSDLVVVSGKSEPMAVTIGKYDHELKKIFGQKSANDVNKAIYFGGGNNTGHPYLLKDGKRFLLLDRVNLKLTLYSVDDNTTFIDQKDTESTLHHVFTTDEDVDANGNGIYYAVLEGPADENATTVQPAGIWKFRITEQGIEDVETFHVSFDDGGAHHARVYEDRFIFLPTYHNKVYVIDKDTMQRVADFPAGKGGGHITFSTQKKIAIVTNHKDLFVTMVDVSDPANPKVIDNIYVANDYPPSGKNAQAHTATFDKTGRYFYSVANCEHKFYEIDTDYGWISRTCHLKGDYVPMGDFVYY